MADERTIETTGSYEPGPIETTGTYEPPAETIGSFTDPNNEENEP